MLQGVLVNGSLGKVVEFIGVHEAQTRYIQMAELERRKEGQAAPIVNSPDAKEGERGLIALDGHTFKKDQLWPLVKFTNGKLLLCSPVEFTVEGLKGNLEARRLQIPLALSWAMSIHKSQGQTLSRVKVDLGRIFEKGQGGLLVSFILPPLTTSTLIQHTSPSRVLPVWKDWRLSILPPKSRSMIARRLVLLFTCSTRGSWLIRTSSSGRKNGTRTNIKKKRWIVTGLCRNGTTRSTNKDSISFVLANTMYYTPSETDKWTRPPKILQVG
jgi:hypothetical protein